MTQEQREEVIEHRRAQKNKERKKRSRSSDGEHENKSSKSKNAKSLGAIVPAMQHQLLQLTTVEPETDASESDKDPTNKTLKPPQRPTQEKVIRKKQKKE